MLSIIPSSTASLLLRRRFEAQKRRLISCAGIVVELWGYLSTCAQLLEVIALQFSPLIDS